MGKGGYFIVSTFVIDWLINDEFDPSASVGFRAFQISQGSILGAFELYRDISS